MSDVYHPLADETDENNENDVEKQKQNETEKTRKREKEKRESEQKKKEKEKDKKLTEGNKDIEKMKKTFEPYQGNEYQFEDSVGSVKQMLGENLEKLSLSTDSEVHKKAVQIEGELPKNADFVRTKRLTPMQVIEKSTAVQGTFCTKHLDDWIQSRRQMVNIGQTVTFKTPTLTQTQNIMEHSSQSNFISFKKAVEKSGWGLAVGLKGYKPKVGVDLGYERKSEEERTSQHHSSSYTSYFCKSTYLVVPVALWAASLSDVSLSKDIIGELKQVETLIPLEKNEVVKEKVMEIFKSYGSHFYCGDIHFGGLFQIKTEYQTDKESRKGEVQEIENVTHHVHAKACLRIFGLIEIGGGASGHEGKTKGKIEGSISESQRSHIHTSLTKLGGPIAIDSVELWKKGLVENNSSWVVVDGGKPILTENGEWDHKDFEGLWNLVQKETSVFKDSIVLSNVLIEIWHAVSGFRLPENTIKYKNINWNKSNINELIAQNANQAQTSVSCIAFFNELCIRVYKPGNTTGQQLMWREELKNNVKLQALFESLLSIQFKDIEAIEIRDTVHNLLQIVRDVHFPQKAAVLDWLKEREQPNTAKLFRSDTIVNLKSFFMELRVVAPYQNITGEVATIIRQLFEKLRTENAVLEYMVFVSFVLRLDFDVKEGRFRVKLNSDKTYTCIDKTEKLQAKLQRLTNMQSSESASQALIIQNIIKSIKSTTINNLPDTGNVLIAMRFRETMNNILEHFRTTLDSMILAAIYQDDVDEILKTLQPIANGQEPVSQSNNSWAYFEQYSSDTFQNSDSQIINNSDDGTAGTDNKNLIDILKTFGLVKYFPERISVQMALSIRDDVNANTNATNIPWTILNKIISANSDFREKVLKEYWNSSTKANTSSYDILDDCSLSDVDDTFQSKACHPSDLFLAIFQCCDPFLKRLIATKLLFCQFAVPILFTNYVKEDLVFSTWPINDVVLQGETETLIRTTRHSVSFIRVGKGSVPSKSKLINEFLRDLNEEHATFIHKDCPLGMNPRTISKGMVEMSWLVHDEHNSNNDLNANGTNRDANFEATINILNLRGDAQDLDKELNILFLLSSVMIVIISVDDLKQGKLSSILQRVKSSNISVILLIDNAGGDIDFIKKYIQEMNIDRSKISILSTFDKQTDQSVEATKHSSSDLKVIITSTIVKFLSAYPEGVQIEKIKANLPKGIRSDESQKCVFARGLAESLLKECMHNEQPDHRKDKYLPLQGKQLWHEISQLEKEIKTTKSETFDNEEKIKRKMADMRRKQADSCNKAPFAFSIFVETLLKYKADKEILQYFVIWFKQMLNSESRVLSKELLRSFSIALKTYESAKDKPEVGSKIQDTLEKADKRLIDASFGIEHFFREVGQVYEAFMHTSENLKYNLTDTTREVIKQLPLVVANLLLLGHPFEIMDGDAANVPQKWVEAVLTEVQNIVGLEKKVVTVSVLGIQSSGKSTLLNTMFGLEFSVSAGRCTKGIYMQLVPVNNYEKHHADYMLVLDTEGLRAPERVSDKVYHDNEIATLVVGLADVVILNLKGECISDMGNILEIVITGLLRLQQVNKSLTLSQSCIFVHQNVSKDAQLLMLQGNRNIVKHLDTMTKDVALQENIEDINHFADVIKFNSTEDIKYIPDLYHGSPGMAPVNQNYSLEVMGVQKCILRKKTPQIQSLTFGNYLLHLQSLWKGIQSEDFIFSFRSILEIKSYGILESEYQRLVWELEEWKIEWMNNSIKPRLRSCKDVNSITDCAQKMMTEIREEMDSRYEKLNISLNDFVKNSELKEHMEHFKAGKRINMKNKKDYLLQDSLQNIKQEQEQCAKNISGEDIFTLKHKNLMEMVRDEAKDISCTKLSEKQIDTKFEQLWSKFVNDLASDIPQKTTAEKNRLMIFDLECELNELFSAHGTLLKNGLKECPIDKGHKNHYLTDTQSDLGLEDGDIGMLNMLKKLLKKFFKLNFPAKADNVIKEIFIDIDQELDSLLQKETEYNRSQFSLIMKKIITKFETLKGSNRKITLTPEQQISVALHVARHSFYQFCQMNRNYEKKHGLQARFEEKKPIVYQIFKGTYQQQADELVATKDLCAELEKSIEKRMQSNLSSHMRRKIQQKFNLQKQHLMKSIMEDLANGEDFDKFMTYIQNPETYVKKWLKRVTNRVFFGENESKCSLYIEWLDLEVHTHIYNIKQSAINATKELNTNAKISEWTETFQALISKLGFVLDHPDVSRLSCYDIKNFTEFLESVIKNLSEIETKLKDTWKVKQAVDFTWPSDNPYRSIYKCLWGCSRKCPWCNEPCHKSDKKHVSNIDCHNCIQHRPTGVSGMYGSRTGVLCIESCNFDVQSTVEIYCGDWCECYTIGCEFTHPAREYKTYMRNWDIQPLADMSNSKYWNWFMQKYSSQLANYYQQKEPTIPASWKSLTKDDAIRSLSEVYVV